MPIFDRLNQKLKTEQGEEYIKVYEWKLLTYLKELGQ